MNRTYGENIYTVAAQAGLKWERIIDFSASINPLGISKRAEKKLKDKWEILYHYPDPRSQGLLEALADFHGLEKTQILPGSGSTEFIYAIPRVLRPQKALIVTPAFSEYEKALERNPLEERCTIHYFETREEEGFEVNVEGLRFTLTEGYDALYLCNPGNPTGIQIGRESLLEILAQTEREKTWFILDEASIDFLEEHSLKREAMASSRLIILRSLTQFFGMPGLRVGYMISNPEVTQWFSQQQEPWAVNAPAQLAATESLKDPGYIGRTKSTVEKERAYLTHGLQSIPGLIPYPSMANYLLVQLHPSLRLNAAELRSQLIPEGILIRDCSSFHLVGPYFFRVAVRSRRENQFLLKALRKVIGG